MALFWASTAILLGFIRYSTVGMMDRETRERIDVDYRVLTQTYRHAGIQGLRRIVEERSGDRAVAGALYLLVDTYSRPLAGNLAFWPDDSGVEEGWIRLAIQMPGASGYIHHQATARIARLPNHHRLLVGRDIQDRLVFQEFITRSLLLSVVIVGVLSLIGGVIISQRMLRRVDELARTANTIIQGDLGTRLPVQGIGDEFDRVAQNVNRMLDQIERLTSGMRTVIDSVAHDLRGPLTRIRGHIELALAGPADAVAYRQALDTALAESERLHRTVDALLHIAQAESGTLGMEMEPIDLAAVARDVLDLYQPFAEDKALRIQDDIAQMSKSEAATGSGAIASCSPRGLRTSSTTPSSTPRKAGGSAFACRSPAERRAWKSGTADPVSPRRIGPGCWSASYAWMGAAPRPAAVSA